MSATRTMPVFPSAEWLEALREKANSDADFQASCQKWGGDRYILVCEEDDDYEETTVAYIVTDKKGISDLEELDTALDEDADFTITAPYGVWKQALASHQDATKFLVRGDIQIEGDRDELLKRAKESKSLLKLLTQVETTFEI